MGFFALVVAPDPTYDRQIVVLQVNLHVLRVYPRKIREYDEFLFCFKYIDRGQKLHSFPSKLPGIRGHFFLLADLKLFVGHCAFLLRLIWCQSGKIRVSGLQANCAPYSRLILVLGRVSLLGSRPNAGESLPLRGKRPSLPARAEGRNPYRIPQGVQFESPRGSNRGPGPA